ncbi:MAG: hypothetical protein JNL43_06090 [Flavobacteriales bacterium]|nr:hypothetical protein [Flavobacteriales bacterium]
MIALRHFFLAPLLAFGALVHAQNIRDSTIALVAVQASYAQQFPGGDMAERFGTNSNVGLGAFRKFRNNYFLGAEGSFIFGNNVSEPGILRNVINSAGQIVDADGAQADVFLYERGWTVFATAGRIFPIIGPNPNSGLVLKFGGGYMRHKVRVQTQKNVVPQLEDEYLEGYDRLAAGPAALAYLGYQHYADRGRVNFHIGLEFMAGATQALHPYNFDTEQYNKANRFDLLTGIRAGWTLPIYKKVDSAFHYY